MVVFADGMNRQACAGNVSLKMEVLVESKMSILTPSRHG
jgi:hypothetical protein